MMQGFFSHARQTFPFTESSMATKKSNNKINIELNDPSLSPKTDALPTTQSVILLRSGRAKKLGVKSEGSLSFHWLTDASHESISLQITANDGGGYFSKEKIPFERIEKCLGYRIADNPFPSKLLQTAFEGKSSNNSGFLGAILRAENLLAPAKDAETQHLVSGDWKKWKTDLLALSGETIEIPLPTSIKRLAEDANGEETKGNTTDDKSSEQGDENLKLSNTNTNDVVGAPGKSPSDHTDQRKTLTLKKK
jgi:hypothetical protein